MIIKINKTEFEINNKYYVSPSGKDTNDGLSEESPFKTYKAAYDAASDGDAIYFMPGEHIVTETENDLIDINYSICRGGLLCVKDLLLYSDIKKTKLYFNCTSSNRQSYIQLPGNSNGVSVINLHLIFENSYSTGTNYNNAIFNACGSNSIISNCIIETTTSGKGLCLVYDNACGKMSVYNNIFINHSDFMSNYSGGLLFENNLLNKTYPTTGLNTNKNNVVNSDLSNFSKNKLFYLKEYSDETLIGINAGKYPVYFNILLKSNGNYYSILDSCYNTTTKQYEKLNTFDFDKYGFSLDDFFEETTIESETFIPVDKFNNFSIVQEYDAGIKILGSKLSSSLIVQRNDIDISMAETVNYLSAIYNQSNSIIKIALSMDNGLTWYTYKNESLELLNITIPLKDYIIQSEMTLEELTNYENAKTIILESGIDCQALNNIQLQTLLENYKNLRLAFAIKISKNSIAEIDMLKWNFDSVGRMYKMNDDEITVDIYPHSVLITPLIDVDLIKTNIVF